MTEQQEREYQMRIRQLEQEVERLQGEVKRNSENSYGLRWIDVPEALEEMDSKIPMLEEVKELAIESDDAKPTHIIIEGDNYHALTCLNYTHRGKIDVIYIDPPYNTGKDGFTYRDRRILDRFPDGTTVPSDHPLRHSYWLSFMHKRLLLAKTLLSDRGVIFISIDDNEQANLKLLCDKVFGEKKFLATIPWRKRTAKTDVPHGISQDYEWILCYCNEKFQSGIKRDTRKYYETDDFPGRPWRVHDMTTQHSSLSRPNCYFTIINPKTGARYPANKNRVWANNEETFQEYYRQDRIVFPGDYDFLKISKPVIRYWKEEDEKKMGDLFGRIASSTDFPKEVGMTQDGTKDIINIFDEKYFDYPKPVSLLYHIINIATTNRKKMVILDFFAGSGTTMHAVMKLNEEDGGHRQCILVNNNENGICRNVTYERNRRVMQGYINSKGEPVDGLGGSMKYYRTAFVGEHNARSASDADRVALSQRAGCLLALAENTLEEVITGEAYQLFARRRGDRAATGADYTAVYFSGNLQWFDDFRHTIEDIQAKERHPQIAVYLFCWGSPEAFEDEFDDRQGITLKAIPQPILDIYLSLNR